MQFSNLGALGSISGNSPSSLSDIIKGLEDQIAGVQMPAIVADAFAVFRDDQFEADDVATVAKAVGTLDFFAKSEKADRGKPVGRTSIERELIERIKEMLKDGIDDAGELVDILALLTTLGDAAPPILIKEFQSKLQIFIKEHADDPEVMDFIQGLSNLYQFAVGIDPASVMEGDQNADGVVVAGTSSANLGINGLNLDKLTQALLQKHTNLILERMQAMLIDAATADTGLMASALDPISNIAAGRRGILS